MGVPQRVYKIVLAKPWELACEAGVYSGSADDVRDGFIHLSFAHQLAGTLARHFAGAEGLLLLEIATADLGERLVLEPSRGGEDFPHLYGELPTECVQRSWPLTLDGESHVLPEEVTVPA